MTEKQLLAWSPAFLQEEGKNTKDLAHTNKIILSEDILYEYR